jgi:hypothetical protein
MKRHFSGFLFTGSRHKDTDDQYYCGNNHRSPVSGTYGYVYSKETRTFRVSGGLYAKKYASDCAEYDQNYSKNFQGLWDLGF